MGMVAACVRIHLLFDIKLVTSAIIFAPDYTLELADVRDFISLADGRASH